MCLFDKKRIKPTSCYGFAIVEKCSSDRGPFYSGCYYGGKYQLLKSYNALNKASPILHTIKNKRNVINTKDAGFYGYTKYTDAFQALKHTVDTFWGSVKVQSLPQHGGYTHHPLRNFKIMFCLFEKVFELGTPTTFCVPEEEGRIALRACKRTLLAEMKF